MSTHIKLSIYVICFTLQPVLEVSQTNICKIEITSAKYNTLCNHACAVMQCPLTCGLFGALCISSQH